MVPEVKGFLAHITGVETAKKLYEQTSTPNSEVFIKNRTARVLFSALSAFGTPAGARILAAESDLPFKFSGQMPSLRYLTWFTGWTADAILAAGITIELAHQLHPDSVLAFVASKIALNAATHLYLDGARSILEKIKGSPIQIRV